MFDANKSKICRYLCVNINTPKPKENILYFVENEMKSSIFIAIFAAKVRHNKKKIQEMKIKANRRHKRR